MTPGPTDRATAAAQELLNRRQARESIEKYIAYCELGVVPAAHHRLILRELEAVERGECSRLMLLAEFWAHEIIQIADDKSDDYIITEDGREVVNHENINRSRLKCDMRRWLLSKIARDRDQPKLKEQGRRQRRDRAPARGAPRQCRPGAGAERIASPRRVDEAGARCSRSRRISGRADAFDAVRPPERASAWSGHWCNRPVDVVGCVQPTRNW
jgi:Bacteriophage Sf6, terminase small subunit-like